MRRQIQPVHSLSNMLSHDERSNESIPKLSRSVKLQVAHRQQDFGANLKLNILLPSISILLLILLSLKQPFNCKLLYAFPMLNLVLGCLHRMHAIHVINWHPQALTKCKVSKRHTSCLCNCTIYNKLNHWHTLKPILAFIG